MLISRPRKKNASPSSVQAYAFLLSIQGVYTSWNLQSRTESL